VFTSNFFQSIEVGVVVAPLPLDGAKNMLVDFLSFSVQCCIFFVAHAFGCYCLNIPVKLTPVYFSSA
jgi:hypothetical protein